MDNLLAMNGVRMWFARSWWIVTLAALVGSGIGSYSVLQLPVTYSASSALLVTATKAEANTDIAAMNSVLHSRMATYATLATSASVLNPAKEKAHAAGSVDQIARRLTVSVPHDSTMIMITARADQQEEAVELADAVSAVLMAEIQHTTAPQPGGTTSINVGSVQSGKDVRYKNPPPFAAGAVIGGLIGLILASIVTAITLRRKHKALPPTRVVAGPRHGPDSAQHPPAARPPRPDYPHSFPRPETPHTAPPGQDWHSTAMPRNTLPPPPHNPQLHQPPSAQLRPSGGQPTENSARVERQRVNRYQPRPEQIERPPVEQRQPLQAAARQPHNRPGQLYNQPPISPVRNGVRNKTAEPHPTGSQQQSVGQFSVLAATALTPVSAISPVIEQSAAKPGSAELGLGSPHSSSTAAPSTQPPTVITSVPSSETLKTAATNVAPNTTDAATQAGSLASAATEESVNR